MNAIYNPDYPESASATGFLQNTYQANQYNNNYDSIYYGGGSTNPFEQYGRTNVPPDSRRNIGGYQSPVSNGYYQQQNQQYQYQPQPQPQPPQEQQVQPFSSYPSGVPNGAPQSPAFNSLAESRRNISVTVNQNQAPSSPWANKNNMSVQQNVGYSTAPPPMPQPQQVTNPWDNPMGYSCVENSMAALYKNNLSQFDRKSSCWDNVYTNSRPIEPPQVRWNQNAQQPIGNNMYQYNCPQFPKIQQSWSDIARNNFAGI